MAQPLTTLKAAARVGSDSVMTSNAISCATHYSGYSALSTSEAVWVLHTLQFDAASKHVTTGGVVVTGWWGGSSSPTCYWLSYWAAGGSAVSKTKQGIDQVHPMAIFLVPFLLMELHRNGRAGKHNTVLTLYLLLTCVSAQPGNPGKCAVRRLSAAKRGCLYLLQWMKDFIKEKSGVTWLHFN